MTGVCEGEGGGKVQMIGVGLRRLDERWFKPTSGGGWTMGMLRGMGLMAVGGGGWVTEGVNNNRPSHKKIVSSKQFR